MRKTLLALTILISLPAFSNENVAPVYLAKAEDGEKFLITESSSYNISGKLDNAALGLCISKDVCTKHFNMSEAFTNNLALSSGVLEIPESLRQAYSFPAYPIEVSSSTTQITDSIVKLNVNTKMEFGGSYMDAGDQEFLLEHIPLTIELNHDEVPKSKRFDYSETPSHLQSYATSVFQIVGIQESNGLGGIGSSHGTGFFISDSGFALTNLHVMESNPECLTKRSCKMIIKQKNEVISEFKVDTRVLTCSKLNDFCLIKIKRENSLNFKPLELQLKGISKNLLTLGFPADKTKEFSDENGDTVKEVALTYSYGSPIGFSGTGISSSMYIYGGASGSPIIDLENGNVVGLNSNGAQTFSIGTDGMPAIFRSIFIINKEFDLLGYLNGEKQTRIESLILKLQKAESPQNATDLLALIANEKSYYGRSKLEVLSYTHSNQEIRKAIFKFLKIVQTETM